jgi:7-keto-8-aminopelargonate synthetase-like enzyme
VLVGAQASGADRRSLPHNDLDALEALLGAVRHRFGRVLIVVEGLYSMDGDHPDLARLVEIKRRFGAWLMVDEAHALGVMGARGTGSAEHLGVDPSGVDIWMGTLSKTLAGCGGYIAGKAALVDYLKCTLPGFVYSVGLAPPLAAAAAAALAVMAAEPERVARLQANGQRFRARALAQGLDVGTSAGLAIVPVMVRDSLKAVMLGQRLFERGINVLPIVHPAVPERTARLRFFITAEHGADTIDAAVDAVAEEAARVTDTGTTLGAAVRAFT